MKVKSINPIGKTKVFNMEVEDTHSFVIQGGVVSHNCADETRYFLMSRPIEPKVRQTQLPLGDDPLNQRVVRKKSIYV